MPQQQNLVKNKLKRYTESFQTLLNKNHIFAGQLKIINYVP